VVSGHVDDQLGAYALGCLEDGEAEQVALHLAECPVCRAEARAYEEVVARLDCAAPAVAPSKALKDALAARIGECAPAESGKAAAWAVDPYAGFAERYDWMNQENPDRRAFFRQVFDAHGVTRVLDCACGTGRDLMIFHEMGLTVAGADLSEAMLAQARVATAGTGIPLQQADFRELPEHYDTPFDAVVCLTNSINEVLEDEETLAALVSMRAVLRPGGILVFDQGQTDASMREPPRFAPVLNTRDFTRLFTMAYEGEIMHIDVFDFVHTDEVSDFAYSQVRLRVRLVDSWLGMLREAGFGEVQVYGDWHGTAYEKESSRRLIVVAVRGEQP
jgi:glycine/sarcosine N-methyltransferase